MNQIKCVETKGYAITEDALYDVIKRKDGYVFITNDNGKAVRYSEDLFEKVPGTTSRKREPVQAAPVIPPPPPPRTEQDCINSISNFPEGIAFRDINNNLKHLNTFVTNTNRIDASCGIHSIQGLNSIITRVHQVVDEMDNDDDLMNLRKELFKKLVLQNIRRSSSCGLILMSTRMDFDDDLLPMMDEISHFRSESFVNPNGGNTIKMWGFYKDQI